MTQEDINGVVRDIEERTQERINGKEFYISFKDKYPLLSMYLPGIMKGVMYAITAASGVSKTQLAKDMFVVTPYLWALKKPNVKYKIIYFALEETKKEFIQSFIRKILGATYKIYYNANEINGTANYKMNASDLAKINQVKRKVAKMLEHVEVVDNIYNPTGIYKKCREFSKKWGTHKYKMKTFEIPQKDGTVKLVNKKVYSHWEPNEKDLHVMVVVDHLNDFLGEQDVHTNNRLTKGQAMAKWVDEYAKKQLIKNWDWTVTNVIQQSAETEQKQFTFKGANIVPKLEPSLSNLGNNKEIQRAHYVILGLFSPAKYFVKDYNGYDITELANYYRCILVLKNRIGNSNFKYNLYHNGAVMQFNELPDKFDTSKLAKVASAIRAIESAQLKRNSIK